MKNIEPQHPGHFFMLLHQTGKEVSGTYISHCTVDLFDIISEYPAMAMVEKYEKRN